MTSKHFLEWVKRKWGKPRENARAEYESALVTIFNSPLGQIILNRWLSDIYCTVSYLHTGRCCDVSYNEGHRAFLHELLETLDRIESGKGVIQEQDAEILDRGDR